LWWPDVSRTSGKLIVQPPLRGARTFPPVMAGLPEFTFNSRKGWYEAALSEDNFQELASRFSVQLSAERQEMHLHLSDGVREWLKGVKHAL